jgi:hypothetical protein
MLKGRSVPQKRSPVARAPVYRFWMRKTRHPLLLIATPTAGRMYAVHLRQLAYKVEEAEDGREALAKAISRLLTVIVRESNGEAAD